MSPHTYNTLSRAILTDLHAGQSTADSIAPRIKITTQLTEQVCAKLLAAGHVELIKINNVLDVYRITPLGLQSIL